MIRDVADRRLGAKKNPYESSSSNSKKNDTTIISRTGNDEDVQFTYRVQDKPPNGMEKDNVEVNIQLQNLFLMIRFGLALML